MYLQKKWARIESAINTGIIIAETYEIQINLVKCDMRSEFIDQNVH